MAQYNNTQLRNIATLKELRGKRGLKLADVERATGIANCRLSLYETGKNLPRLENYNKLAQFFGWEPITIKAKPEPPLAELRPDFIIGHVYSIKKKIRDSKEKDPNCTGFDAEFFFRYEGKQGIHNMFRETHGGWVRTYADYQLVGKVVKEVL